MSEDASVADLPRACGAPFLVVVSVMVNLVLGLSIVALKVLLTH